MLRVPTLAAAMAASVLVPQLASAAAGLAVADIADLGKAGWTEEAIKGRIQETGLAFVPDSGALARLRREGVSPDLVRFIAGLRAVRSPLALADILQLRQDGLVEEAIKGRLLEAGLGFEPDAAALAVLLERGASPDLARFIAGLRPAVTVPPKAVAVEPEDEAPADVSKVLLQDLRPASERAFATFSTFVLDPAYGIRRSGEDADPAGRVDRLQQKAARAFAGQGPIELKVHHFVLYVNNASWGRQAALPAAGAVARPLAGLAKGSVQGPLPAADRGGFEASAQREYLRGAYSERENPTDAWIFIAYLDAELHGTRHFIRYPMPALQHEVPLVSYAGAAIDGAIAQFLAECRP